LWLWRFPVRLRIPTLMRWKLTPVTIHKSFIKEIFYVFMLSRTILRCFTHANFDVSKYGALSISKLLLNKKVFIRSKQIPFNTRLPEKNFSKRFSKNLFVTAPINKTMFFSFIKLNLSVKNRNLFVHKSHTTYYFYNNRLGLGIFNLKKTFSSWVNLVGFIKSLIFYKNKHLVFGNSYFKYEVLSLNHFLNPNFFTWRYSNPATFLISNKVSSALEHYFHYLLEINLRLIFIIDVFYHKKTVLMLRKMNFILIGPVPITSSLYTLDVAMPVSSNSIFSNLFFIRLILFFKKECYRLSKIQLTVS
jgi:hypothetical protein